MNGNKIFRGGDNICVNRYIQSYQLLEDVPTLMKNMLREVI